MVNSKKSSTKRKNDVGVNNGKKVDSDNHVLNVPQIAKSEVAKVTIPLAGGEKSAAVPSLLIIGESSTAKTKLIDWLSNRVNRSSGAS